MDFLKEETSTSNVTGSAQDLPLAIINFSSFTLTQILGAVKGCNAQGGVGTGIFHMTSVFFFHGSRDPLPLPAIYGMFQSCVHVIFSFRCQCVNQQCCRTNVRPVVTPAECSLLGLYTICSTVMAIQLTVEYGTVELLTVHQF
ncbi:hypothetical protein L208DRAFT_220978 [Tricholoma matsutake]|nr:hypothetical protein L208DRAFT_220978 [Tricholoma matsutake 945]